MRNLNAFIVEDSPVIRESLVAALEELAPIQVLGTAEDESAAADWLKSNEQECDLVVIDVFLKAGSGLGVLRSAATLSRRPNLVVLTNYATDEMRKRCLSLGASRVFDKSNEIELLIEYCAELANASAADRPTQ